MSKHTIKSQVWIPLPIEQVFAFFANTDNLNLITPPWLQFKILSPSPVQLHVGALLDFQIKLHGWPLRWRTSIDAWNPPYRFVDRQLRGPYKLWVHEHTFEEVDGGTLCRDRVDFIVPGGVLVYRLLVRGDLQRIFAYRRQRLLELLATPANSMSNPAPIPMLPIPIHNLDSLQPAK